LKKLAVVILNWNGEEHLAHYLPSVKKYSGQYDIIVIDNDSTDNSVSFLNEHYPNVRVIVNNQNGGFAKGYNDGLKHIENQYQYYVLLNSDVEVTDNWITPIVDLLDSNEKIAGAQPKILADKKRDHFEHAGASGGFIDHNGYPFCRGRIFSEVEEDQGQYDSREEIFWATGACMFIRSDVFHQLGGFDESYFAHMEEIDLCWRAKLKGYSFYCEPSSVVYHLGGGTLSYMSPRKVYLNFRNSLFTVYKNYTGSFLFFKIFYRFILDYIALAMFVLKLDFKSGREVIRAQVHFFKAKPELKEKRREIQKDAQKNISCVYKKSIVWQAFLFGNKKFSSLKMPANR